MQSRINNITFRFTRFYILYLLLIIPVISSAQDIHYSQFFNSMLYLNPSLTGDFDGNIRGIINHRNQWRSVTIPYITSSLSIDSRLFENKIPNNIVGTGVFISSDKSGNGNLNIMSILPSISYKNTFGKNHNQALGLGFQAGFVQKKIDFSKLTFASQFYGEDFDPGIPSGENTENHKVTYLDIAAGINYQNLNIKKMIINTGLSIYHTSKPQESFINDTYKLPMRKTFYGSVDIPLANNTNIKAIILVMEQNKALQKTIFARIEKSGKMNLKNKVHLSFGTGLRITDSFILYSGLKYNNILIGISYDINFSQLSPASNYRGGFEISIIVIDRLFSGRNRLQNTIPCLRM